MMKFQITNRLKLRDKNQYNALDKIFEAYINGTLLQKLLSMGFSNIEIFHQIKNSDKSYLMIDCHFMNLVISMEFGEDSLNYIVYESGDPPNQIEEALVKEKYCNNFNLDDLLNKIYTLILNDKRLNKNFKPQPKHSLYKFILGFFEVFIVLLFAALLGVISRILSGNKILSSDKIFIIVDIFLIVLSIIIVLIMCKNNPNKNNHQR